MTESIPSKNQDLQSNCFLINVRHSIENIAVDGYYVCFLSLVFVVQATSTLYCKNCANCDKSMKFHSDVTYTKTIKKRNGDNQTPAAHRSLEVKKLLWGFPIAWKIKVPKYSHIMYQSIANFMYFQKNIRSICSKSTEKLPRGKIAPEGCP